MPLRPSASPAAQRVGSTDPTNKKRIFPNPLLLLLLLLLLLVLLVLLVLFLVLLGLVLRLVALVVLFAGVVFAVARAAARRIPAKPSHL